MATDTVRGVKKAKKKGKNLSLTFLQERGRVRRKIVKPSVKKAKGKK